MPTTIEVFSDFVCPFCYLAEQPLADATEGHDVRVAWQPFELRPEPTPTLRPEGDYLQTTWNDVVYPMAERMGVPIVLPTVSPQPYSRLAFEGLAYAEEHGLGQRYTERVFRAFFIEQRDNGRLDVLADVARELWLTLPSSVRRWIPDAMPTCTSTRCAGPGSCRSLSCPPSSSRAGAWRACPPRRACTSCSTVWLCVDSGSALRTVLR